MFFVFFHTVLLTFSTPPLKLKMKQRKQKKTEGIFCSNKALATEQKHVWRRVVVTSVSHSVRFPRASPQQPLLL